MSRGHVPLRTCVVCSAKTDKRALIRIVRTPSGSVEVDATGRLAGRGAYLCHNRGCWDIALKRNRLDHRLKSAVSPEDRLALRSYAEGLALQPEAVQSG
ncbi:MAG: YlxR family protein [Chloroflexota bacterium]|nr:YlxR family protein [Chloroflexota bacterium]MDE2942518.1 YlxR family protein [Chloroflexota bacterium]MDE3266882.1 YlxR family protein [Chloroflexota bacterium]